jgi:hypothetical protein
MTLLLIVYKHKVYTVHLILINLRKRNFIFNYVKPVLNDSFKLILRLLNQNTF